MLVQDGNLKSMDCEHVFKVRIIFIMSLLTWITANEQERKG